MFFKDEDIPIRLWIPKDQWVLGLQRIRLIVLFSAGARAEGKLFSIELKFGSFLAFHSIKLDSKDSSTIDSLSDLRSVKEALLKEEDACADKEVFWFIATVLLLEVRVEEVEADCTREEFVSSF